MDEWATSGRAITRAAGELQDCGHGRHGHSAGAHVSGPGGARGLEPCARAAHVSNYDREAPGLTPVKASKIWQAEVRCLFAFARSRGTRRRQSVRTSSNIGRARIENSHALKSDVQ